MILSIIIPTRGRAAIFATTLQAAQHAIADFEAEIIVVNDDPHHTPHVGGERTRCIPNRGQGVAAARNTGAAQATGRLLLFLDNDILITATSVRHLLDVHREHPHIALNPNWEYPPDLRAQLPKTPLGRLLEKNQMTSFRGWYADARWRDHALFQSPAVASFHLSIERHDFERSGGYNEKFPYAGFEDYDFPRRLQAMGLPLWIDTRITVYHNEADRLDLDTWLLTHQRRSATRKIAVHLGYDHLQLTYSPFRRILLTGLLAWARPLRALLSRWTWGTGADRLYFALAGFLQAAYIYKGYRDQ